MSAAFFVFAAGAAPAGRVACWWPGDEVRGGGAGTVGGVSGAGGAGGGVTAGGVAPALEGVEVEGGDPQACGVGGGEVVEVAFKSVGVVAVVGAVPVLGELGPLL